MNVAAKSRTIWRKILHSFHCGIKAFLQEVVRHRWSISISMHRFEKFKRKISPVTFLHEFNLGYAIYSTNTLHVRHTLYILAWLGPVPRLGAHKDNQRGLRSVRTTWSIMLWVEPKKTSYLHCSMVQCTWWSAGSRTHTRYVYDSLVVSYVSRYGRCTRYPPDDMRPLLITPVRIAISRTRDRES